MTVPVGAGKPAGAVKVPVSVTMLPGATDVLLVDAWVASGMGTGPTANRSAPTLQPTAGDTAA